jgi:4-hydroxybenzoate polyprenyltransferase
MASYALFVGGMLAIGIWQAYGPAYFAGVAAAAAIAAYHYRLIRNRTREGAFKAFRHNNWMGFAIFAGVVADRIDWKALLA